MVSEEVGMVSGEVGMGSGEVGMVSEEVGMVSEEVSMVSEEVGMVDIYNMVILLASWFHAWLLGTLICSAYSIIALFDVAGIAL